MIPQVMTVAIVDRASIFEVFDSVFNSGRPCLALSLVQDLFRLHFLAGQSGSGATH